MHIGDKRWEVHVRDALEITRVLFARDALEEPGLEMAPPLDPPVRPAAGEPPISRPTPDEWSAWWEAALAASLQHEGLTGEQLPQSVRSTAAALEGEFRAWPGRDVDTSIDPDVGEGLAAVMEGLQGEVPVPEFTFFLLPCAEPFIVAISPDAVLCDRGIIASRSRTRTALIAHLADQYGTAHRFGGSG
ncbi:hypothetical protein MF406_03490 [Georgenia sp. TF02-10]|uniref:hypothetical protein n=1 Tax=Georgenia sp. TF02-10 TaxID=2917725 RepID=UPI001FA73371|nr:hypothetical protein [Georgenia sp. TF02-10]UNX55348.1 hypothetical protein MF406_03490 [Georgenia sp. TF02-10]